MVIDPDLEDVRVSCLRPGWRETPMPLSHLTGYQKRSRFRERIALLEHIGKHENIKDVVRFLVGNTPDFIAGSECSTVGNLNPAFKKEVYPHV